MQSSKDRLVSAMSDLMWSKGYAATSPREVRELAGVGQGSMYHHFSGKHALALAALHNNCSDLLPNTLTLLQGDGSPMERLRAYLSQPRPALKGCKVGRMTQDPLVATDPELLRPVGEAFAAVRAALVLVIGEAIDAGQLPGSLNPARLAATLSATIQGGYVLAIAAQDEAPFLDACQGALDLLDAAGEHR